MFKFLSLKPEPEFIDKFIATHTGVTRLENKIDTGKSLSEALLFTEHGEKILCTKIVLNVRNNFCTKHLLLRFEHGIFMY